MKPLRIIALALPLTALAGCTGNLSSRTARQEIAELGGATLNTDDIEVQRIVQELGDRAIAEANVRMVFEFEQDGDGEWAIVAARLGDRQWIDIDLLTAAIDAQNQDQTTAALQKLELGLAAFRSRNGSLPDVPDSGYVSDLLHPRFMTELVRDDAWGGRIGYTSDGETYELRAPGPDGTRGTGDDIVLGRGAP